MEWENAIKGGFSASVISRFTFKAKMYAAPDDGTNGTAVYSRASSDLKIQSRRLLRFRRALSKVRSAAAAGESGKTD